MQFQLFVLWFVIVNTEIKQNNSFRQNNVPIEARKVWYFIKASRQQEKCPITKKREKGHLDVWFYDHKNCVVRHFDYYPDACNDLRED